MYQIYQAIAIDWFASNKYFMISKLRLVENVYHYPSMQKSLLWIFSSHPKIQQSTSEN